MLATQHRLTNRSDFAAVMKRGVKISRGNVAVHVNDRSIGSPGQASHSVDNGRSTGKGPSSPVGGSDFVVCDDPVAGPAGPAGPRMGLIVSKAVGNAVIRHRVSRKLRHATAMIFRDDTVPSNVDIVIRAFASAAHASTADLEHQLRSALRKSTIIKQDSGQISHHKRL